MEDNIATSDGVLQGRRLANGVLRYCNIPFAAPPVGRLRFQPPTPPSPWSGVRDASEVGPMPLQRFGQEAHMSEDCLYLNVWTPSPEGRRPVLFWIFGGGFEIGSGGPPFSDGANLATRDVVVVSANHRLGALGFAHLADLGEPAWDASSNLGHQDQAAALQWVRTNISSFGGDPENVTVFGESSGAFSIGTLLALPCAQGLFDKAIMQSGSVSRVWSAERATKVAVDLLSALGLRTASELMSVPAQSIVAAQQSVVDTEVGRRNSPGGRSWGTVIDGRILPKDPEESLRAGGAARVPLIVGANREECQLFAVFSPETFAVESPEALVGELRRCVGSRAEVLLDAYRAERTDADLTWLRSRFFTDWIYRIPALRAASAQRKAGGSAWHYLFSWSAPGLGAAHGMEIPFVFDRLAANLESDPATFEIKEAMVGAWIDFAKTGDPGWPQYDEEGSASSRDFGGAEPLTLEPPPGTRAIWFEEEQHR